MPSTQTSSFGRHLALAVVAAVALRLALIAVPVDPYANPDSDSFRQLAQSLVAHGRLAYVDAGAPALPLRAFRSLLYPVFLAPAMATRHALALTLAAQGLLGIGVVIAMALLARRAFGDRVGMVTAWIGALYAASIVFERQVTSEALFTPLLVGGFLAAALVRPAMAESRPAARGRPLAMAAGAGLLLGLAALTRPAGAAGAVAIVALALAVRPTLRPGELGAFALAFGAALACAMLRNRAVLGAPVLLTSGGMNFWIGCGRGTVGDAWEVMRRILPARGELGAERWFYADTWAHAGAIAHALPGLLVAKVRTFATPFTRDPWFLAYRLTWPFAALALLAPRLRRAADDAPAGAPASRAARWLIVGAIASQAAVAFATVPWSRYRAPLEPFLWPLAAVALVGLWRSGARGRLAAAGISVGNAIVLAAQVAR